jgi:hypothetical protein
VNEKNMTELTLAQLERIMEFTQQYLEYYQYTRVFADDKVALLVSNGLYDKFTDEEKLKNSFEANLKRYDIEVKKETLL